MEKISKVDEFARMVAGSKGTPDEKIQLRRKLDDAIAEEVEAAVKPVVTELEHTKEILANRNKVIIELKAELAEIRSAFSENSSEGRD